MIVYPSHNIAMVLFHLSSSWEWQVEHRIRSYVPILPFIAAYKFLRIVVSSLRIHTLI